METSGDHHSLAAELGIAVVFALMALRLVLRIREDGQVTEDLVRNEEDFRDLVESSSDGIAIVDDDLHLLFTSPAARRLLGLRRRRGRRGLAARPAGRPRTARWSAPR